MTPNTLFPLFEDLFITGLKLQEQATNLPKNPETGHGVIARATCFSEFSQVLDNLCAVYNKLSPVHWPDLSIEVNPKHFENTNKLVLDLPTLHQKPEHTDLAYIFGLFCAALDITELPEKDQMVWDTLKLPQRLQTPQDITIDALDRFSFEALSLGDAVGQSIVTFKFWDETVFDDVHTADDCLKNAFQKGYQNTQKYLSDYLTDKWDAGGIFLGFLAEKNILEDREYYSLCSDARDHISSYNCSKSHDFLSQLADVVRQVPNGGRWGGYFVSPNYEEGDYSHGQIIVHARNAQHALAVYMIEESHNLFSDIQYHNLEDFTIRKISSERNTHQTKEEPFLV
mgnify:CR=1 FL=1